MQEFLSIIPQTSRKLLKLLCMTADPKIPWIVKKVYLKYSYKFETLVPFKILPLWLDAVTTVQLPLLETMSKTFNGQAVKGCQWFLLNLCNVSKMPPFQTQIHSWEQKKVARSKVRWAGGTNIIVFLARREAFCWHCRGSTRIAGSPWEDFCWRF